MSPGQPPDFIGLGAQKAGTSWIHACLDDHPEVCAPVKEPHFFSRDRNWERGIEWYEGLFARCRPDNRTGEFSTSYLSSALAASRIHAHYPQARLIVCLRDPVDRARSNWLNDVQSGHLAAGVSFEAALDEHPEYLEQGRYATLLTPFFDRFPAEAFNISLYDDLEADPAAFIAAIYRFLGIDASYVPFVLQHRVNSARVPRSVRLDHFGSWAAQSLRRHGLSSVVAVAKRAGVARVSRRLNSRQSPVASQEMATDTRRQLVDHFAGEIDRLESLLDRSLDAWRQ